MRGFGLLVLFAVACSSVGATDEPLGQGGNGGGAGRAEAPTAGSAGSSGHTGDEPLAGAAGAAEAGAGGEAGIDESGSAGRSSGGSAGTPAAHSGAGGRAGAGGSTPTTGGSGGMSSGGTSAVGGSGSAPNQCSGFVAYTVEVNTCLSVTGDYQLQTDQVACSQAGIRLRDHCTTCAAWDATGKPSVVLLSLGTGATMKRYDTVGGVCPSNCKYICN